MWIFFRLSWHFKREKSVFKKASFCKTRTDYPCKTSWTRLRLVRSSFLISAIQRVLRLFSGKLFYKSNRKLFPCVCIGWYKHSRRWQNSRQLRKPSTSSRVCITVSNSPNTSRVYIRLCKHGKRFLLLKCKRWFTSSVWNSVAQTSLLAKSPQRWEARRDGCFRTFVSLHPEINQPVENL